MDFNDTKRLLSQKTCPTCGSNKFKITNAGPHRKLSCADCRRYLKFVTKDAENLLRAKEQITC